MHSGTEQTADVADPLWSDAAFPLVRDYFPLGFATRICTNSSLVLAAAEESWGLCRNRFQRPPVHVHIGVSECLSGAPAPPVFRAREHLMSIISDSDNFVSCDMRSGYAFGWVTDAAAREASFFRYHFLEAAVLTLIEQLYLAPVHAALIVKNGTGILLCGDTGAGKSTLAYACARSGWTYVSDDGTFLLRDKGSLCAIGNCRSIRFKADGARLFPELQACTAAIRPNGKLGFELPTSNLPDPIVTSQEGIITDVVFLDRGQINGHRLVQVPVTDPKRVFARRVSYGEEHVRVAQQASYSRLAEACWWKLSYDEYAQAVPLLEKLAARAVEDRALA